MKMTWASLALHCCWVSQVFLNLFSAPESMAKVPEMVAKEIMERFNRFMAQIQVTVGLTRGKTLLPLPPITNSKKLDPKDLVHMLENAVVQWTTQIKNVLSQVVFAAIADASTVSFSAVGCLDPMHPAFLQLGAFKLILGRLGLGLDMHQPPAGPLLLVLRGVDGFGERTRGSKGGGDSNKKGGLASRETKSERVRVGGKDSSK